MINYQTEFNTDGAAFPATAAINVSTPGAGDGTEFIALMVNDIWGAKQALLYDAGFTPNGSSETYANSQIRNSIKYTYSPVGTVFMSHTQQDPSYWGFRFLELVGQGIVRNNYPELDTFCYVGDGNNGTADAYYRANDAGGLSRSPTGAYLILPDMRGVFVRGRDPSGVVDPQGPVRLFPSLQDHAMDSHNHECFFTTYTGQGVRQPAGLFNKDGGGVGSFDIVANIAGSTELETYGTLIGTNESTETRPTNYQVRYWVRY